MTDIEKVVRKYMESIDLPESDQVIAGTHFAHGALWEREQSKVLSERIVELEKTIDAIDGHIRLLRCDGYISMTQMIEALKVLSDNYPER